MVEINRNPRIGGASSALAKVGQGAQTRTATRQPAGAGLPRTIIRGEPERVGPLGVTLPFTPSTAVPAPQLPGGTPGGFLTKPPFVVDTSGATTQPVTGPQGQISTVAPQQFVTIPSVQTGLASEQIALPAGLQAFTQPDGSQVFILPEGVPPTTEILAFMQAIGQPPTQIVPPGAVPTLPTQAPAPALPTLPVPAVPAPPVPQLPAPSVPTTPTEPVPGVEPASFFAEFPGALPGRNFVNEIAPFILGAAQGETPEAFQQGVDVLTQLTGEGAAPAVETALQALTSGLSDTPQGGFDRSGVEQAQEVFRAIASGGTTQSEAFQNAVIQPVLSALADAGVSRSGVVGSQVAEATIPFLLSAAQNLAQTSLGQQAQSGTLATQLGGLGLSQFAQRGDLATALANLGGAQQGQQLGAAQIGANLGLQGLTTEEGIANNLLAQLAAFGGLQQSLEQAGLDQQAQLAQALLLGPTSQALLPGAIGQSGTVPGSFAFGIPGLFSAQK